MVEAINALIEAAMTSSWAGLAIFLVCALDAFFPVVPSETTVIAAGVLAASGNQNLLWVIGLAAAGAFVGDHVSYTFGRVLGRRGAQRLLRGGRGRTALAWAEGALGTRGGLMIVALRFVPGGRTATTLMAGILRYPLLRFSGFDAVAVCCWAAYSGLIGYFAGGVFRGNHLLAVVVGVGVSVGISAVVETIRLVIRRRASRARALRAGEDKEDRVVGGVG